MSPRREDSVEQNHNRVQWVYSASDPDELARRYDRWAAEYDGDLDRDFGYFGPALAADYFARYVPLDAHVLDAGAGTGLVGVELAKRGYTDINGLDISQGMLDEARKKGVYRRLDRMTLGEHLDYESGEFDAVISVGVLTLGHAPASSLDELVRVTKTDGWVVFGLRPDVYAEGGFKQKQDALRDAGVWRLVEVSDEVKIMPRGEPEVGHQVWVYRVL
jgi:SAM-dependent methyltransferase